MKNEGPFKILMRVWAIGFVIVLAIALLILFLSQAA
jgi:hypothetical protein